jgi:hypothetical protein
MADIKAVALSGITWLAAVAAGLWLTRSTLPQDLRRKKTSPPAIPNPESRVTP